MSRSALLGPAVLTALLAGCRAPGTDASANDAAPATTGDLRGPTVEMPIEDAGPGDVIHLGAANFQVSVVDAPAWPESGTGSKRLGYLRHGTVVDGYDRRIVNDDCTDGWLRLVQGGFVCGKAVTTDLNNARVRLAPRQPDRDAGMPYRYGVNVADGTPLYRRVLGADDRKRFERRGEPSESEQSRDGRSAEVLEVAKKEKEKEPEAPSAEEAALAPSSETAETAATAEVDAGEPPPKKRLRDLRGRGVLVRKMARGFYLALDRDFKAAGDRWWRTTYGFATPYGSIMLQNGVTKHAGSWFSAELLPSPVDADGGVDDLDAGDADGGATTAPIVGFASHSSVVELRADDAGKVTWSAALPKRSSVMLTGRVRTVSGMPFHETTKGTLVRLGDFKIAEPRIPADLAPGEKWIDVDLTRQALVAFEGRRPVFATLISSGRRNEQDKEHDFPTPTGTFHILSKHVSTTMDGDVASDGPYSIEDVPWVMYFQGSYALHGAFWHDAFGNKRSHGCVNLAPEDARGIFAWSNPPLPEGWHGVNARDERSGTRVVIHEDAPPSRRRSRGGS